MKKSRKTNIPVMEIAGVLAGAITAGIVKNLVSKQFANMNNTVKSAIPLGVGVVLAMQKNSLVKNAGVGMIAKGGFDIVKGFAPNLIEGPADDSVDALFYEGVNLPADQSILSLPADQSILAGLDEDMIGEDEEIFLSGDVSEDDEF